MPQLDKLQIMPQELEEAEWQVNTGSNKIHAKRMSGRFRRIKWLTASLWLLFFLGPYVRWDDRQAVLFDISARQFHLFGLTVHPQDFWLLTFVLIFFAALLAVVTVLASRVYCGYFCFQTVWTDLFSWIEERLEGPPRERVALDASPWGVGKTSIKLSKHVLWLVISMLTGVSFAAWFTDAYQLWVDYFNLQAHTSAWVVLLMFTLGTYLLAGFMREQVCFWLCPYARIQGVLYDQNTLMPTYDEVRGEPRAKLDRSRENPRVGCVDCDQCVAVCPTGIDIREGQQIGCITCGLCIDACDSVMEKINQPRGLIRYESWRGMHDKPMPRWHRRPQVVVLAAMIAISILVTAYGINNISAAELSVTPRRQPTYVVMNDGAIQNAYHLRILNKSDLDSHYRIGLNGLDEMRVKGNERPLLVPAGEVVRKTLYVKVPREQVSRATTPLNFQLINISESAVVSDYQSVFLGPDFGE